MRSVVNVVLCVLALLTASIGQAQTKPETWKFDTLTVSAGEDPLSSGITGSLWLQKGPQRFNFVVQHKQGWFMYGRTLKLGRVDGVIAGSVGHFDGSPWIGPFLTLELPLGKVAGQKLSVSTLQWPAIQVWVPDGWKDQSPSKPYIGYFASFQANVGPVGLSYGWLNFLDDPINPLPGISYTQKIRKDFGVTGSVTRNTNAKKWMLFVGATKSFGD